MCEIQTPVTINLTFVYELRLKLEFSADFVKLVKDQMAHSTSLRIGLYLGHPTTSLAP